MQTHTVGDKPEDGDFGNYSMDSVAGNAWEEPQRIRIADSSDPIQVEKTLEDSHEMARHRSHNRRILLLLCYHSVKGSQTVDHHQQERPWADKDTAVHERHETGAAVDAPSFRLHPPPAEPGF